MDGQSRVAEQTRNGVRGIVQEIDELRCRFGATALNMLTPKAEVSSQSCAALEQIRGLYR